MSSDTLYDHPEYYDILFGWDRSKEAEFYRETFARCGVAAGGRVLEVACGPGRVACLLARSGFAVTGLDASPGMLDLLRRRAAADGLRVETLGADMTSFSTTTKFAAACNPLSSFRLLQDDLAADAHLERMAAAIEPRGVYVLDLEFTVDPDAAAITTDEPWEMRRGEVTVRAQNDAVYVVDHGVERVLGWGREGHLRPYTVTQFRDRMAAAPGWSIESWHGESGRPTGVSEFHVAPSFEAPAGGRSMVVLRRRSRGARSRGELRAAARP
jgi:SAM-dependent methyltransferase